MDATIFCKGSRISRKKYLHNVCKCLDLKGIYPTTESVFLPGRKIEVDMTVFNLEQSIYSLLTDPDLMNDDNLVFFDKDDPTKLPNVDYTSTEIDEFVHGSRFRDAANEVCKGPNDVALPLCIFIDKSHCDSKGGKLSLEPFQFTFAYFCSLRNQPHSWRVAGFIPNSINLPKTTANKNAMDYHCFYTRY